MKKNAFTLAEVLITLAIIGVVTAMTMPTLIQNHQKKSLEVATKKFYSMMSQAVKQYMADEGVDDLRNTDIIHKSREENTDIAREAFVKKYLNVIRICPNGCFAKSYKMQNGDTSDTYLGYGKFILSDGIIIDFHSAYGEDYSWPLEIIVDINGNKGPNKIGYDLWTMSIFYDGSIDESNVTPECKQGKRNLGGYKNFCGGNNTPSEARAMRFETCQDSYYGGCFGHFLENGFKFDY